MYKSPFLVSKRDKKVRSIARYKGRMRKLPRNDEDDLCIDENVPNDDFSMIEVPPIQSSSVGIFRVLSSLMRRIASLWKPKML